jgi:hypothetical protein
MLKAGMKLVLAAALAATPVVVLPQVAQAQQPDTQRAYQAGYNNGVNDRNQNKPLNLKTGNWQGINLNAYRQGYENGYRSAARSGYGPYSGGYGQNGQYGQDNDRWRGHHDDDDRDRDRNGYNQGYYPQGAYGPNGNQAYGQNNDTQRAYQAGFNNGVNDRSRGKGLNLKTDNWHGINLNAYRQGYQDGYRRGGRRW